MDGRLWRLHCETSSGCGHCASCLKPNSLSEHASLNPASSVLKHLRPWIDKLKIPLTKKRREELADKQKQAGFEMCKASKDGQGERKVAGGRHLKQSGAYPVGFGSRVAALHLEWQDIWQQS